MIRWGLRALALVYIALPIATVAVGISTVRDFRNQLAPLVENAVDQIGDARDALQDELDDLEDNFQPLVNAISRIRSALLTIRSFVNNSVNAVIDFVNTFPGVNISDFDGFDLPALFNVGFLDDIADHLNDLTDGIDDAVSGTALFLRTQGDNISLTLALFGAWVALGYVLGAVAIFRSLWG